eukprot:TRINITY_DN6197_c0_g1_i8.p1 TRINITY_DN6197_c0_g1~~TRINITY_DN6197_c0_g1_i8.p1  ORF type:complete len:229 (-),score=36.29 TRINITY_DN6197_c0_g1_i8:190-876(-)
MCIRDRNPNPLIVMPKAAPQDEHNLNYYQEYCKLFIANVVLTSQIKELLSEKNELLNKLTRLEVQSSTDMNMGNGGYDTPSDSKKKRFRRTAAEIDRHYRCPIEKCMKSYGSEGSLNQHIKLKHPGYVCATTTGKSENGGAKSGTESSPKNENGNEKSAGNAVQIVKIKIFLWSSMSRVHYENKCTYSKIGFCSMSPFIQLALIAHLPLLLLPFISQPLNSCHLYISV